MFIFLLVAAAIIGAGSLYRYSGVANPDEKLYVAVEGDGIIAVINPATGKVIKKIDLALEHEGGKLTYAPHNVQVAPDGKSVWVTANAGTHMEHSSFVPSAEAHGDEEGDESDQVIVVDPEADRIIQRIPLGAGLHLAHVVVSTDGSTAYVTAQDGDAIFKISAKSYAVSKKIDAPQESEPHGIRLSPDGKELFVAFLKGKNFGILYTDSDHTTLLPMGGSPVQTGVTPDGRWMMASLYDTKKLFLYLVNDIVGKNNGEPPPPIYVDLPASAEGPIQMYPTPDSRFVYLADQGYYFGQPAGSHVYKIDLASKKVVKEIVGGNAPHGIVVSKDGSRVYVTNLLSGDVSVIDTARDEVISTIAIGKEPNGISLWSKKLGGTP